MGLVTRLACAIAVVVALGTSRVAEQPRTAEDRDDRRSRRSCASGARTSRLTRSAAEVPGGDRRHRNWLLHDADGYIATNAHVVSDIHDGDDAREEAADDQAAEGARQGIREGDRAHVGRADPTQLLAAIKLVEFDRRAYVVLPNGDKLDYEIEQYGKPGSGRDAAIIKVKTENAPTLPIADSSKTQVADHDRRHRLSRRRRHEGPARREDRSSRRRSPTVRSARSSTRPAASRSSRSARRSRTATRAARRSIRTATSSASRRSATRARSRASTSSSRRRRCRSFIKDAKVSPKQSDTTEAVAARPRALLGRRVHRRDQRLPGSRDACSRSTTRRHLIRAVEHCAEGRQGEEASRATTPA